MLPQSPFVALQHRNFRLLWTGQLISFSGSHMQTAALLWHVSLLVPPDRRAIALGMVGLVRLMPIVFFSIAGAAASMYLQRYFIIVGTAFGGAWTMLVGAMALVGDRTALAAAASGDVWVAYPLDPAPGQRWVPIAWLVLGGIGAWVQLGFTGGEKGRIGRRRK